MSSKNVYAVFFIIGFLQGCLNIEKRMFSPAAKPRRSGSNIEVGYQAKSKKYVELGQLSIQYNRGYEREKIIERLKDEAAALGADGILLGRNRDLNDQWQVQGRNGSRQDSFGTGQRRLSVIMYRYVP